MKTITTIGQRIAEALKDDPYMTGDYIDHLTPTFRSEADEARFDRLSLRVTQEMETPSGIAWTGIITDGEHSCEVYCDGNGGSYTYTAHTVADCDYRFDLMAFAEAIYPDCVDVEIDTLVNALDVLAR